MDGLAQRFCTHCYMNGQDNHLNKKEQKENQERVSEPFGRKPTWSNLLARPTQGIADLQKQLSTTTIIIAISLATAKHSYKKGYQKTNYTQPSKYNIKEPKCKIGSRNNPKVITPTLILLLCHIYLF